MTEIVLARSATSIMLTGVGLRIAGVNPLGNNRGLLLTRGLAGSLALLCFFEAGTRLPLASATVLQYTYPTFTAAAAWILLAEPLRRRIGLAVAVGWIGVDSVRVTRAHNPRSVSLTWPSPPNNTLSGLTSRCANP